MSDKSYNISAGQTVDDMPGFRIYSYLVDNYTSQYLFLQEPNRFVPPKTAGVAVKTTGDPRVVVRFQAPPGISQPASVTGEQAVIRVLDTTLPVSAGLGFGLTIPPWLTDGTAQSMDTEPSVAAGGSALQVPPPAVAFNFGAWVELLAAGVLPNSILVGVSILSNTNAQWNGHLQIGTGAAGLEVAIGDFPYQQVGSSIAPYIPIIPFRIITGSPRVAARIWANIIVPNPLILLYASFVPTPL